MKRQSGWWLVVGLLGVLTGAGCGGSSGGSSGAMNEDEVISFCQALIEQVESESDATQLAGLEQARQYVAGYNYVDPAILGPLPAPGDPVTYEPDGETTLYRMLGTVALLNGNGAASAWATAEALLLEPDDPAALSQLGVIMTEQERCQDAERLLRTAISHDADQNELHHLSLAAALACQHKPVEARQEVAAALELAPGSVMARTAMMDYRSQEVDYIVGLEDSLYALCENDINEALHLASTQQVADFTMTKQQEAQAITQQMMNMYMSMPADVPPDLLTTITDLQGQYDARQAAIQDVLDRQLDALFDAWSDNQDMLSQQLSDCCVAAGGGACCGCFKNFCQGNWGYLNLEDFPASQEALAGYLQDSLRALVDGELELTGTLMGAFPGMSDQAVSWTAQLVYVPLSTYCKTISLGVAGVQQHIFGGRDIADAHCSSTEEICQSEEYLAEWLARQRELEEAERAAAAEALRLARAAAEGKDDGIRGEVCLDSLGCLGIDGSKLSLKIGGPLFAQFSVDTDRLSVGVRVGAGLSDPTGGNIVGADISIGGEVGASGTSFDVTHSQSAALGTAKKEYHLFKRSFKF